MPKKHLRLAHFVTLFISLVVVFALITAAQPLRAEVLTDRCSGDVFFPYVYDAVLPPNDGVLLTRKNGSATGWSTTIVQRTDASGHIRWYCNSTTGNWFDPGTWQISGTVGGKCDEDGNCKPTQDLSIDNPSSKGSWTAERSRCDSHTGTFRARLGSNRLLQIDCVGVATSHNPINTRDCRFGQGTCTSGFVWREANPSDHICVAPTVRQQSRLDNANAAGRRAGGGSFGHDTCKQGFVWREAFPNDHVCVTPAERAQAAFDNRYAQQRNACP